MSLPNSRQPLAAHNLDSGKVSALALASALIGSHVVATDLVARRVSNRALLATILAAVAMQATNTSGSPSLAQSLTAMVIGLVALLPFYAVGWMGAGDVKLFSVIGLLHGPQVLLPVWLSASVAAGLHALVCIYWVNVRSFLTRANFSPVHSTYISTRYTALTKELAIARQGRTGIPYAAYMGIALIAYACGAFSYD